MSRALSDLDRLSEDERTALLDLLADPDSNNWQVQRRFPIFSIIQVAYLREHFGELYRASRPAAHLRLIRCA